MTKVSHEARYLFDLRGFLVLPNVLSATVCRQHLENIRRLEDENPVSHVQPLKAKDRRPPKLETCGETHVNGILRQAPCAFQPLIDHPKVLPYLQEFLGKLQLFNTWSISKTEHGKSKPFKWHRGLAPGDYSCCGGQIRSRMVNVVFMLTANGPYDGGMLVIPGSHKANFELEGRNYPGLQMPGSFRILNNPGDVLIFTESLIHAGLPRQTPGKRVNIYFNYVCADFDIVAREPQNCPNFYIPKETRQQFTEPQQNLLSWMACLDV